MNNMTEKLIRDGSETRKAKMNMASAIVGALLMLAGLTCLIVKTLSAEYVDQAGMLHEHFFLIPVGFLFLICGAAVIAAAGIHFAIKKHRRAKTGGD